MVRRSPWLLLLNVKGLLRSEPSAVFSFFRGERLVILTESWLSIEDTPPTVPNYRAYNFPRPTASTTAARGARGGVGGYVSLDLASFATPWPEERYHGANSLGSDLIKRPDWPRICLLLLAILNQMTLTLMHAFAWNNRLPKRVDWAT